jgi:transcriptional regulator with XRE-family HTH domain
MGRLRNYLRTYRRQWHLTQEELAFLFGYLDQSIITRLEQEERAVTLAVAHATELLFGVGPSEVFPALFESIEADALTRMRELRDRLLQSEPTQRTLAKLELLEQALGRMTASADQQQV